MKDQHVIFKIVNDFESIKTKRIKAVLIISIIMLLIGLPTLNYYFKNETINQSFAIIAFISIIISGFSYYLSNKTKTIGKIMLTETLISGDRDGQSFSETLSNIAQLDIKFTGFEGESTYHYSSFHSRSGNENYLTIATKTGKATYQLYIENEMQVNILKRLLIHYKENGIQIWTKDIG